MEHEDRFADLDTLSKWQLVNEEQDIRGWPVRSVEGQEYGKIEDMLVDKDRAPQWIFESVSAVPSDYVDAHFRAPWDGDHPLRDLPDVKP